MASLFRLRGRALQLGNLSVFTLSFLVCFFIMVTVNFLPIIYIKIIEPYVMENLKDYYRYIGCGFSVILSLLFLSLWGCTRMGNKRYFFKRACRKRASVGDIFFYLSPKNFFSCSLYFLRICFMKLMLLAFFLSPFFACFFILSAFSRKGVSALVCISLGVTCMLLLINGLIYYSAMSASFFLCDYYFIEGKYVSFPHIIASSQKMMKDEKKKLRRLKASFLGWFLTCLLILPVTYVWSYYNQSLAVAAEDFMRIKEG